MTHVWPTELDADRGVAHRVRRAGQSGRRRLRAARGCATGALDPGPGLARTRPAIGRRELVDADDSFCDWRADRVERIGVATPLGRGGGSGCSLCDHAIEQCDEGALRITAANA